MSGGALALQLSPELALILFTAGVLLIYIELNRPGMVLPGAAGLLLVLLALGSLLASGSAGSHRSQLPQASSASLARGGSSAATSPSLPVHFSGGGLALIGAAGVLLLLDLLRRTPVVVALAATLALCLGLEQVISAPATARIPALPACLCGVVLGGATAALTRIARRARANKAVD